MLINGNVNRYSFIHIKIKLYLCNFFEKDAQTAIMAKRATKGVPKEGLMLFQQLEHVLRRNRKDSDQNYHIDLYGYR